MGPCFYPRAQSANILRGSFFVDFPKKVVGDNFFSQIFLRSARGQLPSGLEVRFDVVDPARDRFLAKRTYRTRPPNKI